METEEAKSLKPGEFPPTYIAGFHYEDWVRCMEYRMLGKTGFYVSKLSLGGSSLAGIYNNIDVNEATVVMREGIKRGVNLIDTAPWYGEGRSECLLGQILLTIPRKAYFLCTKVGRYQRDKSKMFDFSAKKTLESVNLSLERLKVSYIDLVQVHDIEFAPNPEIVLNETLVALDNLRAAKKVRFVGITGYPLETLKYILSKSRIKIDTILSYCHSSLHDDTLHEYSNFFKEKQVAIISASPMSMGLLTDNGPPMWHPSGRDLREACAKAAQFCRLKRVSISKLAMHFSLSLPYVDTTLVSTDKLEYLYANLEINKGSLTETESEAMVYICEHFFKPLKVKSWEGIELEKYKTALKKLTSV